MQALRRLISILETVSLKGEPSRPAEIAVALDLPLPTVARLMHQLAAEDLLHRSGLHGGYTLGPRFLALARIAASRLDLAELARPILEELRDATGETTSLHVLRGTQRVCISEVQSLHEVRRVLPVGSPQPLQGSATGAVLLAGASDDERRAALKAARLSRQERVVLEERLQDVRRNEYALVVDDWVRGLAGISFPVRDGDTVVAALSVSGPSNRFTEAVALGHRALLADAAHRLSARLGDLEAPRPSLARAVEKELRKAKQPKKPLRRSDRDRASMQ